MIQYLKYTCIILLVFSTITSCTKRGEKISSFTPRKIKFVLFTYQDFADNEGNITFSLLIKNSKKKFLDSTLSTIKIKDIPVYPNKWELEKTVRNDDGSLLDVGFVYTIENVGYSWHLDTCRQEQVYKIITYPFL